MDGIRVVLDRAGLRRPILLHRVDATVWHFAEQAIARRWSTRVGLEDGDQMPDGRCAASNTDLVQDAITLYRA
ncbi:3-keto-5-aminohexanoate cleavage protein [Boseongicola sp. H5]|uniref:3-keto-5-aminohexanoate cleavage protein n=1 Tax=Boseongicola sp. H5 TaxID=2763261 RepID=UPI001D09C826|nr:3-keto-5-aminohexanoate cleavage protein [Boseongicola sp. H5]